MQGSGGAGGSSLVTATAMKSVWGLALAFVLLLAGERLRVSRRFWRRCRRVPAYRPPPPSSAVCWGEGDGGRRGEVGFPAGPLRLPPRGGEAVLAPSPALPGPGLLRGWGGGGRGLRGSSAVTCGGGG